VPENLRIDWGNKLALPDLRVEIRIKGLDVTRDLTADLDIHNRIEVAGSRDEGLNRTTLNFCRLKARISLGVELSSGQKKACDDNNTQAQDNEPYLATLLLFVGEQV
jgi:hypothetical protein